MHDFPRTVKTLTFTDSGKFNHSSQGTWQSPKRPMHMTSAEFNISPTSVYQILTALQLKPNHLHLLQALQKYDFVCRVEL